MPTAGRPSTDECSTAAVSSSAGPIRFPAMLSVSSDRPRNQKPSSSTDAQSPWVQTPGNRLQYVSM